VFTVAAFIDLDFLIFYGAKLAQNVIPQEFTTYFRSVIVFGQAHIVESVHDRIAALRLLAEKYSPGIDPSAEIDRFIKTVCIIRIDIDSATGKEAIELTRQKD